MLAWLRWWRAFPRAWPPGWVKGGRACRPESANGWHWPGPLSRDAPLLLLDEPTANLDGETEQAVLAAVRRLMEGRTVIMAAHRPSLLALADRVIHLDPAVAVRR